MTSVCVHIDTQAAVQALARVLDRPLTALLCAEVGGGNCLEPLIAGEEAIRLIALLFV